MIAIIILVVIIILILASCIKIVPQAASRSSSEAKPFLKYSVSPVFSPWMIL